MVSGILFSAKCVIAYCVFKVLILQKSGFYKRTPILSVHACMRAVKKKASPYRVLPRPGRLFCTHVRMHATFGLFFIKRIIGTDDPDPAVPAAAPAVSVVDVVIGDEIEGSRVLRHLVREAICRKGDLGIVLAPCLVGFIEFLRAGFTLLVEGEIPFRPQEVQDVVRAPYSVLDVVFGLRADREPVAVRDEPVQALKAP